MGFFEQTSGTFWNILTVLLGSSLGLVLQNRLPERIITTVMQALGLTTLLIGVVNALDLTRVSEPPGIILGLIALAAGGALGELWGLEEKLESLGNALKARFKGQGRFTEGFVAASLLFCVGPLTLIGSIQNGLAGDDSFLLLKATLDGFASLALSATFGFGVIFSVFVIALYQGGLSLFAGLFAAVIPDPGSDPRVLLVNGVGGLMILGLGFGLLDIKRLRVASLLPALVLVIALYELALLFY
ncbi:MAG: DUF554 domain-containing protein [Deinococcota bacterium]|nr:DUF554 domain-containing protein [Deinococcota bacterium]